MVMVYWKQDYTGVEKEKNIMAKYVMALDAGTTSNRCILFDKKGTMCSVAQREFKQYFPKPGWVEHDADEIWASMLGVAVEAMSRIGATAQDIAAIGITNQRETSIVWDKNTGEPVYHAIVWQCRRTSEYCDSLKEKGLTEKFRRKTGLVRGAAVWYGGDLADLEADQRCCSCDGLFQRIQNYAVQYQYPSVG